MKINTGFQDRGTQPSAPKKPSIGIDPNPKRERVILDAEGNEIRGFKNNEILKTNEDN